MTEHTKPVQTRLQVAGQAQRTFHTSATESPRTGRKLLSRCAEVKHRDDALIAGTSALLGSLDKAAIMVGGAAAGGQGTLADIVGFVSRGKQQVQAGTKTINSVAYYDPAKNVNSQATAGAQHTLTFITRWTPMRTAETA